MDEATIQRLLAINRDFYRVTAEDFDQTRGRPWPGWDRVWDCLRQAAGRASAAQPLALAVLDVGCGNGRFGVFLAQHMGDVGARLRYHGLDTEEALLERAREALGSSPAVVELRLERRDVIQSPPASGQYDLVALFGLIHHVPGRQTRQRLMRALGERVAPGGLLAFACWRFYEYGRFRERIVPWPEDLAGRVEAGDYLLDWRRGVPALRYCHYVDDDEQAQLVAATGLTEVAAYRADGRSGDANRYSILRRGG